jgi:endonuclease YncB( thermonuclease family)
MRVGLWPGTLLLSGGTVASIFSSQAQTLEPNRASMPVFDFPQAGVEFLTGDTWRFGQQTFRLYGIQSCLRGTSFTNASGAKKDCGEASLAYTAAIMRDTRPRCTALATAGVPPVVYTVCAATVGRARLDLGTILITEGFAFAAADANGRPVNFAYAVAEGDAQRARRGLWQAPDLPYPTRILTDAARSAAHQ